MTQKVTQVSKLKNVLKGFPEGIRFCFAYGSGVFKQKSYATNNMLDLIFAVQNPDQWHAANVDKNPTHYAQPLRFFGHKIITKVQKTGGAKIYYNTLIRISDNTVIKYGVVCETSLVEDLLDWNMLYLAGRLHKPVDLIIRPDNSQLRIALVQNLHFAVHAALLLLPDHFTEIQFYKTIVSLSYNGDFRMIFGEDKNKISNIVLSQLHEFRKLYAPILKHFDQYMKISKDSDGFIICSQDLTLQTKIYHLNHLPRILQIQLVRSWSQGPNLKDIEDCLRAFAYDSNYNKKLDLCLRKIVRNSSVTQSLKGILTAGLGKAIVYSSAKIVKMIKSINKIN